MALTSTVGGNQPTFNWGGGGRAPGISQNTRLTSTTGAIQAGSRPAKSAPTSVPMPSIDFASSQAGGGAIIPPPPPVAPPVPTAPPVPPSMAVAGLQSAGGGGAALDAIHGGMGGLLRRDLGQRNPVPNASVAALQRLKVY